MTGLYLKSGELGHDGGHDLVCFGGLHALGDHGLDVVAADLRVDHDEEQRRAFGKRCRPATNAAYHSLRIKKLQNVSTAGIGAGVDAGAQPTAATRDATLGKRPQKQRLVVD